MPFLALFGDERAVHAISSSFLQGRVHSRPSLACILHLFVVEVSFRPPEFSAGAEALATCVPPQEGSLTPPNEMQSSVHEGRDGRGFRTEGELT